MTATVTLRAAGAADVAAVVALEEALFAADAWSEDSVREELTGPRRHALVAVSADGAVVGYAVTLTSGDVVDLQRIAVTAAARRTGVASALLAALRAEAIGSGAVRMLLEVAEHNEAARAFYAARGFVAVDRRRRYYRDGADAVVLSLPLTSEGMTG